MNKIYLFEVATASIAPHAISVEGADAIECQLKANAHAKSLCDSYDSMVRYYPCDDSKAITVNKSAYAHEIRPLEYGNTVDKVIVSIGFHLLGDILLPKEKEKWYAARFLHKHETFTSIEGSKKWCEKQYEDLVKSITLTV